MSPRIFVARIGVDDGADHRAGQGGVADRDRGACRNEALHEAVVDPLEQDEPRQGRAFLAGEAERAVEGGRDRLVEVRVIVDDQGVLPPHLADDLLQVGLARGASGPPPPRSGSRPGATR